MIATSLLTCMHTIPTEFSAFFSPRWRGAATKVPAQLVPIRVDDSALSSRVTRRAAKELERLARMAGFTP